MAELAEGFDCRACGKHHDVLPLSFSVKAPLALLRVPVAERARRVVITPEQCVIDDADCYLRGRIVVPIVELAEPFIWGVWAAVSPKDFFLTQRMWTVKGREAEPAYRGRLETDLALFGETVNLELRVKTQVVGRRPHFEIVNELHPLAREQREGISMARVREIAERLLHPRG